LEELGQNSDLEREVVTLANGAGIALVGKIGGSGLNFIAQVLLARWLGAANFGIFTIGMNVLVLIGTIGPIGMQHAIIRFGSEYWFVNWPAFKRLLFQTLTWTFIASLAWGAANYFLSPWLAIFFQKGELEQVFRIFAFAVPAAIFLQVIAAATRVSKRMTASVIGQDLGQPFLYLLFLLVILFTGVTIKSAIIAQVLSYGGALILASYLFYRSLPGNFSHIKQSRDGVSMRQIMSFSMPVTMVSVFNTLNTYGARILVAYFLPARELGIYQAALQISVLFAIIMTAINSIFAPMISSLYARKEMDQLRELYRLSIKWGLYISLPAFLVVFSSPAKLLQVIYGNDYTSGSIALIVLTIAQLINIGTGSIGYMLIMTGRPQKWMWASIYSTLLNFVLGIVLIPLWGLAGAAVGSAIATSFMFLIGIFQLRKELDIWPYDFRFFKGIGVTLVTWVLLQAFRYLRGISDLLSLILLTGAAIIMFWILLYVSGWEKEDELVVDLIKKRTLRAFGAIK
jgi:O-antigen/teichoic acid export membrane protein